MVAAAADIAAAADTAAAADYYHRHSPTPLLSADFRRDVSFADFAPP